MDSPYVAPGRTVIMAERHLSQEQLASRWNVSPKTIRRLRQSGKLPALQVTRSLYRFKLDDILEIEKQGTMFPTVTPKVKAHGKTNNVKPNAKHKQD